ncbi:PLAT/LH2 domain-containing protein [Bacillus subtilis]|nr:PLAT/LH2 domain-containing protein [Bacillus subtilis]MDM5301902.1 PLAT/LH2 domain-containing protein [Bacillus subtilis]MDM5323955.1 PLAT/LH2 domain-containing protein [Bacillus subtilis]
MTIYNFKVHTGDEVYAGTDSNIFVKLHGDNGETAELRLNGYIGGNAFERNQTDSFSIDFPEDYGDIHALELRSDTLYAGSDWLLSTFEINKKGSDVHSKFVIDQWIKDKVTKRFFVTSGYNKVIPEPTLKTTNYTGGTVFLPAGEGKISRTISTTVTHEINYETVQVFDIRTHVKISVPIDVMMFDLEQEIHYSIQETMGEKFGKTTTIEDKVELTAKSEPQELVEQWILEEDVYEVTMGNKLYQFEVPVNKRFAGFKEKVTKKPVEVKMVDHTESLEPNKK